MSYKVGPIRVSADDKLTIDSKRMQEGRTYHFPYLGVDMLAIRYGSVVNVYQIVDDEMLSNMEVIDE